MKSFFSFISILITFALLCSCKSEEKPKQEIIVPVPKAEVKKGTQSMQETNSTRDVQWLNAEYKVVINRHADKSLPLAKDEYNQDYYDNVVTVRVLRADGSEAINHVFHKSDFMSYITDSNVKQNGALLGVVFDKIDNGNLAFAASVGSPNNGSDEYIPLIVHINRMGAITVALDTNLDADMPSGENNNSTSLDDEGV